jgi:carbon monoxide dehydrogenase subunit G
MAKGSGSIHIDRPADEVFAFVADAENNPRWRSYVTETRWLDDGPMRVGRKGVQVSRVLGRRMEVEAEIVEWDPPRHVAWQAFAGSALVRTDCWVEPEDGGCRLTISAEGDFTNPVMRLLSPLAIGMMKRQSDRDTKKLKAALESGTEASL